VPDGDVLPSCTIVTCDANELTRAIHDRMPVILPDLRLGSRGSTRR
jgi:putative SOS response-associated peptidase YedK